MYNTSQNYKDKILNDSTQHELNIYIDDNKIEPNHIIDFKCILELFNNSEFCLGCTPEIDIEFEIDKRDLPETYNEVRVESGLEDEIIPVGKFTIQSVEDNEFKVKIKATDYMKKFEDNKYDGSDLTYPATMLQVLQDICNKIGVELGSTSFLNFDKQIAVYDNTVTARTYIGYIAEQAGGFAVIGRDGKLYIKTFGEDTVNIDINLFADFKWGEKFKVSRVSYEDGTQNYKYGDETASTVYINQNNMYIVDSEQIEKIYNQIKDFEVYSFEGETIIDPAYDIGDVLVIDGKKVIYQGEIEYAGKFKANIKSDIQEKTEQESMQTKSSSSEKIRKIQSTINQIDGKITQLVQETTEHEEKLTEHEISIDSISDKVNNIVDLTKEITGITRIALENCAEGEILELHIYGNNTVFKYQCLSDDLYLSNNLLLGKDKSTIILSDSDGNKAYFDLGIKDVLRQNGNIRDEYILKNGKVQIIRRINQDGTIKKNEEIEDLGEIHIFLPKGNNILEIKDFSAIIDVKWAVQNEYTDIFATKAEMNSNIEQSSQQITLSVDKKLEDYSTTTEMNSVITQTAESINSEVRKKVGEDEIISRINQSAEQIQIQADKIDISGKAVNFRTNIEYTIGPYTSEDEEKIKQYILGNITLTPEEFERYDIKQDNKITSADWLFVKRAVANGGYYTFNGTFQIDPYSYSKTISLYNNSSNRQEFVFSLIQNVFSTLVVENQLRIEDDGQLIVANNNGQMHTQETTQSGEELFELYIDGNLYCTNKITCDTLSQTSLEIHKKNFEKMSNTALETIKNIDIYKYNLKSEKDGDKKHIGFVIGDNFNYSQEVTSLDDQGVDNYSFTSLCCKAIQEQQEIIEQLKEEIKELKGEK